LTGLFLRYCWRCNSTTTMVKPKDAICFSCGEKYTTVDAHALICALGAKLDSHGRRVAVDDAQREFGRAT
jgi:hypothetical protein